MNIQGGQDESNVYIVQRLSGWPYWLHHRRYSNFYHWLACGTGHRRPCTRCIIEDKSQPAYEFFYGYKLRLRGYYFQNRILAYFHHRRRWRVMSRRYEFY